MEQIQQRDKDLLKICFEQKFLNKQQIREWVSIRGGLNKSESAERIARRRLNQLKALGLIETQQHQLSKKEYVNVTATGVRYLIDLGLIPENAKHAEVDAHTINHDSMVTNIRLCCMKHHLFEAWQSDRCLKLQDKNQIPDAVVSFFAPKQNKTVFAAIEVELTVKQRDRLKTVFKSYDKSDYQLVLYFMESESQIFFYQDLSENICSKVFYCTVNNFLETGMLSQWINRHDSFFTHQFAVTKGAA